jgi:hypothetical protein
MKLKALFILGISLIALAPGSLPAQRHPEGNVEIICDPAVSRLVEAHIRFNEGLDGIPGYRIQVFFDSGNNSKTKGQTFYESFAAKYPGVSAYLTFKAPNYKVRVGDFRTRLDAVRFLRQILPEYPGAYVIADQIKLPNPD